MGGEKGWLQTMPIPVSNLSLMVEVYDLSAEDEGWILRCLRRSWALREQVPRPSGVSDRAWLAATLLWGQIDALRVQAEERYAKRSSAGKANSARRWDANRNRIGNPNGIELVSDLARNNSDSINMEQGNGTGTPRRKVTKSLVRDVGRSRRVPATFAPDESHHAIAEERGVDLQRELASMRDHEFASARSDWAATFRNWLRRASPVAPVRGQREHPTDAAIRRFLTAEVPL